MVEIESLTDLICHSLFNAFKLERIGILYFKSFSFTEEEIGYNLINLDPKVTFNLLKDKQIRNFLKEKQGIVLKEEIINQLPEKKENIKNLKISLFSPLIVKDKLIGLLLLGEKISGEPYSLEEIKILAPLSSQISIALSNAIYFLEINERKKELEKFYKMTVNRELRIIELEKKIRELEAREKEG